jgi:hypothetical protein
MVYKGWTVTSLSSVSRDLSGLVSPPYSLLFESLTKEGSLELLLFTASVLSLSQSGSYSYGYITQKEVADLTDLDLAAGNH